MNNILNQELYPDPTSSKSTSSESKDTNLQTFGSVFDKNFTDIVKDTSDNQELVTQFFNNLQYKENINQKEFDAKNDYTKTFLIKKLNIFLDYLRRSRDQAANPQNNFSMNWKVIDRRDWQVVLDVKSVHKSLRKDSLRKALQQSQMYFINDFSHQHPVGKEFTLSEDQLLASLSNIEILKTQVIRDQFVFTLSSLPTDDQKLLVKHKNRYYVVGFNEYDDETVWLELSLPKGKNIELLEHNLTHLQEKSNFVQFSYFKEFVNRFKICSCEGKEKFKSEAELEQFHQDLSQLSKSLGFYEKFHFPRIQKYLQKCSVCGCYHLDRNLYQQYAMYILDHNFKFKVLDIDRNNFQIKIKKFNHKIKIDTLNPQNTFLNVAPDTHPIESQINSINNLLNSKHPEHQPLKNLFLPRSEVQWPVFYKQQALVRSNVSKVASKSNSKDVKKKQFESEVAQIGNNFKYIEANPNPILLPKYEDWYVIKDFGYKGTDQQVKFVLKALNTPDFVILDGPPGSGKTTAIIELICQLIKQGKRVLLVASTHVAVDNVLERILRTELKKHVVPLRIGLEENVSINTAKYTLDNFINTECSWLIKTFEDMGEDNLSPAQKDMLELLRVAKAYNEKQQLIDDEVDLDAENEAWLDNYDNVNIGQVNSTLADLFKDKDKLSALLTDNSANTDSLAAVESVNSLDSLDNLQSTDALNSTVNSTVNSTDNLNSTDNPNSVDDSANINNLETNTDEASSLANTLLDNVALEVQTTTDDSTIEPATATISTDSANTTSHNTSFVVNDILINTHAPAVDNSVERNYLEKLNGEKLSNSKISLVNKEAGSSAKTVIPNKDKSEQNQKQELRNLTEQILDHANLICGTTIGILQYYQIKNLRTSRDIKPVFDMLILDEASKTTFQEFLVPAIYARRWAIIGDPKQLSPYAEEEEISFNIDTTLDSKELKEICYDIFSIAKIEKENNRKQLIIYVDPNLDQDNKIENFIQDFKDQADYVNNIIDRNNLSKFYNHVVVAAPSDLAQNKDFYDLATKTLNRSQSTQTTAQILDKYNIVILDDYELYKELKYSDLNSEVYKNYNRKYFDYTALLFSEAVNSDDAQVSQFFRSSASDYNLFSNVNVGIDDFSGDTESTNTESAVTSVNLISSSKWAKEISWRLIMQYQQRVISDENNREQSGIRNNTHYRRYEQEINMLLPISNTSGDCANKIFNEIKRIFFPSILETLRLGFKEGSSSQLSPYTTTFDDGLDKNALFLRMEKLTNQHRMHSSIAKFPSQYIYNNKALDTDVAVIDNPKVKGRNWEYEAKAESRVQWIQVEKDKAETNRYINVNEADRIIADLDKFVQWNRDKYATSHKKPTYSVAILTFYNQQRRLINDKLREYTKLKGNQYFKIDNINIEVCTVDKFQGNEADFVFLSFTCDYPTAFIDNMNRLNVALTRARQLLKLYGDCRHGHLFKNSDSILSKLINEVGRKAHLTSVESKS